MAKSRINCATPDCTHTITLHGSNRREADRKAAWAEDEGFICQECRQRQHDEANAEAAEQNQAAGLPKLVGSDKQIAWAEKIRADKIKNLENVDQFDTLEFEAFFGNGFEKDSPHFANAAELLKQQNRASWWIDNRDIKVSYLFSRLFAENPPKPELDEEAQQIMREAELEATVRPEEVETETVAEISVIGNSIKVYFPEKREEFRTIIKASGYRWSGNAWKREIKFKNGVINDRAAEIGHILLGSGFIIRIFDERIRQMAIDGHYTEEQTRWITAYKQGEQQGRFCVSWSYDENYYKAAKRIPTAKYVKPNISISAGQFEQVLDFAEINGFDISECAQQLIDEARETKERALTVQVAKPKTKQKQDISDTPEKLNIPETVEIDDDLRD